MKHSVGLIMKLVALMALALGGALLLTRGFWFTSLLVLIVIVALIYTILRSRQKDVRRMEQMIAAIRYGDLNIAFPEGSKGEEGELNRSMNKALASFRSRLHDNIITEAETDAWQKLIRVLTHEMMNSLTPIISLSQTVLERAGSGEPGEKEYRIMLEAMQSIQRRSSGLVEFVENYRRLTRIPIPVKQVFPVEDMFRSIRGIFPQKDLVAFRVEPPDMRLFADRSLIEQVLINLIKNALEAFGEEVSPQIRVEAFEHEGKSIIRVSDNGNGIVPEAMERIFVPFYTTKPGGSGIGLSLSRQIMSRHNGSLTAESSPGQGSVFTIRFSS